MTEDRIQTLADAFLRVRNFYVATTHGMYWSPLLVGGCHRPTFAEFLAHSRSTWDRLAVIKKQREMDTRHQLARMKREEADA